MRDTPEEILVLIIEFVYHPRVRDIERSIRIRELSNLASTCRALARIAQPHLFRSITLSDKQRTESLYQISRNNSYLLLGTSSLTIGSFWAGSDARLEWLCTPRAQRLFSSFTNLRNITMQNMHFSAARLNVWKTMLAVLPSVGVQSLHLKYCQFSSGSEITRLLLFFPALVDLAATYCQLIKTSASIVEAKPLLSLKNVSLQPYNNWFPLYLLSGFLNDVPLQTLSFSMGGPIQFNFISPVLRDISESLTHLSISLLQFEHAVTTQLPYFGPFPNLTACHVEHVSVQRLILGVILLSSLFPSGADPCALELNVHFDDSPQELTRPTSTQKVQWSRLDSISSRSSRVLVVLWGVIQDHEQEPCEEHIWALLPDTHARKVLSVRTDIEYQGSETDLPPSQIPTWEDAAFMSD